MPEFADASSASFGVVRPTSCDSTRLNLKKGSSSYKVSVLIKDLILQYIDSIEDETYLESIYSEQSYAQINHELKKLIELGSDNEVVCATFWICDSILYTSEVRKEEIYESLVSDGVIGCVEKMLHSERYSIRRNASRTLGRICSRSSLSEMKHVFEVTKEHDPINLKVLGGEIRWLNSSEFFPWFKDQAFALISPISKWAILDVLDSSFPGDVRSYSIEIIDSYTSESDSRVSGCARKLKLQYALEYASTKDQKMEIRSEITKLEKNGVLFFSQRIFEFENSIIESKTNSYSMRELLEYLERSN